MMEWLYKIISRVEFYVLLVLIATAGLFFSIFKDLPNSANGYSPTVRETILLPLFVFGSSVFLSGLIAFFVLLRVSPKEISNAKTIDLPQTGGGLSTKTNNVAPQLESVDSKLVSTDDELQWEDKLVASYKELPKTQQRVVTLICEMPPVDANR